MKTRRKRRASPPPWKKDGEALSSNALIWRGQHNRRACEDAIRILRQRGHDGAVQFLTDYQRVFRSTVRTEVNFWRYTPDPAPGSSWLASSRTGSCFDCGQSTDRRYNGYPQCGRCADGVQNHGGHAAWKRVLEVEKRSPVAQPDTAGRAMTVSRVPRLMADPTDQIAAANARLKAVGQVAYEAVKAGPLADAVASLREEPHVAAA